MLMFATNTPWRLGAFRDYRLFHHVVLVLPFIYSHYVSHLLINLCLQLSQLLHLWLLLLTSQRINVLVKDLHLVFTFVLFRSSVSCQKRRFFQMGIIYKHWVIVMLIHQLRENQGLIARILDPTLRPHHQGIIEIDLSGRCCKTSVSREWKRYFLVLEICIAVLLDVRLFIGVCHDIWSRRNLMLIHFYLY